MTDAQMDALSAKFGPVAPQPSGTVDKGPGARAVGQGMRPAPKADDADVTPDLGKRNVRLTMQGRNDQITTPEARAAATTRQHAENPIEHDPLAGMILQSMVAGGAGKVLAPLGRLASGAGAGAVAMPDHPLAGAALGMLPGAPGAVMAADQAIGERALEAVTRPAAAEGKHTLSKAIGGTVGAAIGHKIGGPVGAFVGGAAGTQVREAAASVAASANRALAERYLRQQAARKAAGLPPLPSVAATAPEPAPPPTLAPLVHRPPPEPTAVPNGALGTPLLDDFGMPITRTGPVGPPSGVATSPALAPGTVPIPPPEPAPGALGPITREDIARDAAKFGKSRGNYKGRPRGKPPVAEPKEASKAAPEKPVDPAKEDAARRLQMLLKHAGHADIEKLSLLLDEANQTGDHDAAREAFHNEVFG